MKTFYLLGYPVEHSMSSIIHNAAFKELGLDYHYELLNVEPKKLEHELKKFRCPTFGGANITIPHKLEVMKYLDAIDEESKKIGAVNTIINKESQLIGYNTDGKGAIRALIEAYGPLNNADVVLIGAGGAARAIGYHLIINAGRVQIFNRTWQKAQRLVEYFSGLPECRAAVKMGIYNHEMLGKSIRDANILINATPLGMYPNIELTPVEPEHLDSHLLVFDTVYNPINTKLIKDARKVGADTLPGLNMLVYQGVLSFQLWTGRHPPEDLMYKVAEAKLKDG